MPSVKVATEQGRPIHVQLAGHLVNITRWDSQNEKHRIVVGRTDALALADTLVDVLEMDNHE